MEDKFLRVSDSFEIGYMADSIGNHKQYMHIHSVDELVIVGTGCSTIITSDKIYKAQGAYAIFYPAGQMHQQLNSRSQIYLRHCIRYDRALTDSLPPDIVPRSFFVLPLDERELAKLRPYLELMI
ncbi:MAG: hypothetical protein E7632_08660, partial [Ruminococcaceae bacterium]|nr:hypothetical protein [Oscillospiraceae bacterium]